MRFFLAWAILSINLIAYDTMSFAKELSPSDPDWNMYKKTCDAQWKNTQNGRHRHVGRAVCACLADQMLLFKNTQPQDNKNQNVNLELSSFYQQAFQICTTNGILANTASRADFDSVNDIPTIEMLCKSSWVGLMGLFNPADKNFSSKAICQCAAPGLAELTSHIDQLSPQTLRLKSLALVKQCDPSAKLSPKQFALLSETNKQSSPNKPSSKGQFILEIKNDPDPTYNQIATYLRKTGRLKEIVEALNQSLSIPYNINIITTATDEGPYYLYDKKTIYLDYKILSVVSKLYDKYHPNEPEVNKQHYINNLMRFFLYHELGHALIDAYKLPVLGQEEDGSDALSAVISLQYLPKGFQVLVDAADFFKLLDEIVGTEKNAYWDTHALNKQRYYRLLCYAYGKSPTPVMQKIKHYYNSSLDDFIKERADYCDDEYNYTYQSWMDLLSPYLKSNQ